MKMMTFMKSSGRSIAIIAIKRPKTAVVVQCSCCYSITQYFMAVFSSAV